MNELVCTKHDFGSYALFEHSIILDIEEVRMDASKAMWKTHFDGA